MATKKENRTTTFEHDAGVLTFNVAGIGALKLTIANVSAEARDNAIIFGFARKVTNAAALDKGASAQDKYDAMSNVVAHLNSGGTWNSGRIAGSGGGAEGLVIIALMRVYGDTAEKAEATITRTMAKKGLDRKAALKLWSGTDKIAAAIVDIKAERAAKAAESANVDADELMDELDD